MSRSRPAEALATGLAGGVLAGAVGLPLGVGPAAAAVGAVNGVVSGWRRIYAWRTPRGASAFVLDSTWGLLSTAAGLASNAASAMRRRPGFVAAWSERRNRHVYERGFTLRKGFALTMGNVITGAGGRREVLDEGRQRLVDEHEDLHVWQARLLGPIYPVVYVTWMVGGTVVAIGAWLLHRRQEPLGRMVDTFAYYANPFEWWAYSRAGNWPPSRVVPGLGWRRPMVRSYAELRFPGGGSRPPHDG